MCCYVTANQGSTDKRNIYIKIVYQFIYVSIHKNIITTKSTILWILIWYEELAEFMPSDLLSMLQYNIYKTVYTK